MTRQELWDLLKKHGLTQSRLSVMPTNDAGLKIVVCNAPVSAKKLISFLCSLDGKATDTDPVDTLL